jgi:hypothetical protein
VLAALPSPEKLPRYFYPGARTDGGSDGVLIRLARFFGFGRKVE